MRFPFKKWFPPPRRLVAAVVSGVLLSLAFTPASLGPLCFVGLIPVFLVILGSDLPYRKHFQTGYVFGVAFFITHMYWVVQLIPASSLTIPWIMPLALVLIAMYLAVYPGLFFLVLPMVTGRHRLAAILAAPALWACAELLRSGSEFGFPWGLIGYGLSTHPEFIQFASVGGIYGLSALVVLINVVWANAVLARTKRTRIALFVAGALVFVLNPLLGSRTMNDYPESAPGGARVALIQPNVDLELKWEKSFTDSTFNLIERLTREASALDPQLIVFPETCAPMYLSYNPPYEERIANLSRELDTGIYIGTLDARYEGPDRVLNVYNSSRLFEPGGAFARYDKMHLLPFGESIPYGWRFRWLRKLNFGQANFTPGPKIEPIESPAGRLGPLICFEGIFPGLARRFARDGADLLLNITNDGWFGETPGPYQQTEMTILRAVETRLYLLRSANTGVSMVVDPAGRIVISLGLGREGFVTASVHRRGEMSTYTRYGDTPLLVLTALIVAGTIVVRRVRRRPVGAA